MGGNGETLAHGWIWWGPLKLLLPALNQSIKHLSPRTDWSLETGLRSRPNFSDSDSDSDPHKSFFHVSKSNVLKQWYLLCNAFDAKYCWQTTPFYLQFEKVEAQFEKAEVQFEKGEAQFEKDEVQFEIPEIQFEKDETQIEKDKVGFEITKTQFEKIVTTQFETAFGNYGMNTPACAYQPCL